MSVVGQMLYAHPDDPEGVGEKVRAVVEACGLCAQVCVVCADACMREETVAELVSCARSDLDCADLCEATQRVLVRRTAEEDGFVASVLQACVQACDRCARECEEHAEHHEHCRVCAEACRACSRACQDLLDAL
ncbi:MAG TPA: four-helix bundle copper-binding protein [Nocardiopsis listeri]|uniref:four-helix bundle copper-binding protein n=1 Tax=Nocardiopsis listeri TaxID=53440 RepID=UPI001D9D5BE6|nr:four-helix bundle copper-binding protein [Nocardiopsis listeri]HJE56965.1 four-helix bundle copper-binding protein [Nocardiopsis listeri]